MIPSHLLSRKGVILETFTALFAVLCCAVGRELDSIRAELAAAQLHLTTAATEATLGLPGAAEVRQLQGSLFQLSSDPAPHMPSCLPACLPGCGV